MKLVETLNKIGYQIEDFINSFATQLLNENNIEKKKKLSKRPGTLIVEKGKITLDNGDIITGKLIYNGRALNKTNWMKTSAWQSGIFENQSVLVLTKDNGIIYITTLLDGEI